MNSPPTTPITDLFLLPEGLEHIEQSLESVFSKIGITGAVLETREANSTFEEPPLPEISEDAARVHQRQQPPDEGVEVDPGYLEPSPAGLPQNDSGYSPPTSVYTLQLEALSEITVGLPGLAGVTLVLNPGGLVVEAALSGERAEFTARLDVGVRVDGSILRPVRRVADRERVAFEPDPSRAYVQFDAAGAAVSVGTEGIDIRADAAIAITEPIMIGDTGIVIESAMIGLRLGEEGPRPSGTPESWRGVLFHGASIRLPELFDGSITADDLGLGSGGVSGTFGATDVVDGEFMGLRGRVDEVSITLQQNIPVAGSITGEVVLPFFDERVEVAVAIGADGFNARIVGAPEGERDESTGLVTLTREDVFTLVVESLEFTLADTTTIRLSGTIIPEIRGGRLPGVRINSLSIDAEGNVDIEGGWIDLPDQYQLDFHGFQLELTRLGLGRNDDDSRWLGLNGGLQLVEGLPAGASVEGLRITWDESGLQGVSFDGVGIEFEIEGVLRFDGEVAYVQDGDDHRFKGAIDLDLISLGMQIDAQLVVGRRNGYTYFAIYVGADLPAGIPLFTTGLALYGMAGLYAQHMEPGKTDAQQWYSIDRSKSWYHSGEPGVAVLSKWEARRGSMAFGAGVTIGTASDNGYAFNGKLLLVIMLPGPVILLEGRANLMKKRAELDAGEPNFRTLAVLDNREGSFLFGLDAQYKFDEKKGRLIDIRAGAEAFYSFSDPNAWYCYLGKKEPHDQRIAARMYDLFEATAYYMLDAERLQLGARVGYDLRKSAGPLRVELSAWLEAGAALNWMPPHFFGELLLHGGVRLSAFGIGLGLTVDARVAADIFDPFHLLGTFSVALETPPLLPDPSADITLEWGPIPDPPPLPLPLKGVAVEHFKTSAKWPLPRTNGEHAALLRPNYDGAGTGYRTDPEGADGLPPPDEIPIVPVDGRPHLTFAQPVRDEAQVGVNPASVDWVRIGDPEKGEGPVKARFNLDEIVLEKRSGSDWTAIAKAPSDDDLPALFGSWAPIPPLPLDAEATDNTDHTPVKLWLWAKNPFAYALHTGREWEDWFLGENASFPCVDVPEQRTDTYDFEEALVEARLDVEHEGTERYWRSPDGATFRWDERVFEVVTDGEIRLSRNDRRVFSRTVWHRDREDIPHATLERSVLRVGRSSKRYVVDSVVSDFYLDLARPYNRFLMAEQETRADYAFYVDPRIETASYDNLLSTCTSDLNLSKALMFDFAPSLSSPDAPPLALTIELPRTYAQVTLDLCVYSPTDLVLLGFNRDEQLQGWTQESLSQQGRVTLSVKGNDIRTLRLHYPNQEKTIHVLQITGKTVPQEEIDERRRMAEHLQEETRRWEHKGNVLEPNETYRLRIKTRVEARGEDELAGYEETLEQTEFAYFRTGGPPAVPAIRDGGSSDGYSVPIGHSNPSQFSSGLSDLRAYVEQTIPVTVSGDSGMSLQPRPVYRAYDVGAQFNEDYVELMYRQAQHDLGLYLFDNNDRPVRDNQGRILPANNYWGNTEALGLSDRDARWIETLEDRDCVSVSKDQIPHSSTLTAKAHGQLLRPDAVHEARLVPMLLHESFDGIVFHGWQVIHGQRGDWTLDRSRNLQGTVDHVDGPVVHLGGSPDLSSVTPGLHLFSFDPPTTGLRPAYQILAVNPGAGTITLEGRPDVIESRDYDYEIVQPGPVRHTARTTGAGLDPLRPGALVARGESTWSDYRISIYARTEASGSTPTGSIGVVFRQQDGQYYRYALHAQPAVRRLTHVDGSSATVLDEEGFAYDANRDYQLTVEAVGERIRVYQDGALVFDVTDAAQVAGGVGLYAWDNDRAAFRDVRVDDLRASAPAAYRFSFVTSRYAHFHHHLHSYQDETWPATIDPDAVSAGELVALAAPSVPQAQVYAAPTDAEASAYDQLAQHALGAQSHAFPETVEVTRVQHDGTPVAWLVRSPEPIDWTRTALHVRRATGGRARAAFLPGRAKITGAAFGPDAGEGLTLLVRERSSLEGVRIEYRHHTLGAVPTDLPGSDDVFGGLLLDAPFEAPLSDDWAVVDQAPYSKRSSDWQVRDGALQQTENYYGFVGGMVNAPGTYVARSASDWSDYRMIVRLRSGDDDAIGAIFRYVDQDNYYRFSMDRQRAYRRLIKKEDGGVTILWEDGKRYRRGHTYDLRIDCQGERLKASLDGNPLFDVTDAAHPAGGVGLYCRANRAAHFEHLRVLAPLREWAPYHVFDDATTWGDGTVVRLHSTGGYAPTETAEHYAANAVAQQGATFSPHGTEVRLVAPDGTTLHRRHVSANDAAAFAATDLRLLRRADGTAFALVRPVRQGAVRPLQPGPHRLSFTFRRDNQRHDEESVVLRQNGDSAPEHATLEVPWETLDVS